MTDIERINAVAHLCFTKPVLIQSDIDPDITANQNATIHHALTTLSNRARLIIQKTQRDLKKLNPRKDLPK